MFFAAHTEVGRAGSQNIFDYHPKGLQMNFSLAGLRGNLFGALLIAGGAFSAVGVSAQDIPLQLTGTVKDGTTQAAVAGAKVNLLGFQGFEATTDADGAFTLLLYDPAGINPGNGSRAAARSMRLRGTNLTFSIAGSAERVKVTLHDMRGQLVATIKDGKLPAGDYSLSAAPTALPAGLFVVRAVVGNQSKSFRMSTLGGERSRFSRAASTATSSSASSASSASARAKRAIGGVDVLVVVKEGYLKKNHEVMVYAEAQDVKLDPLKVATTKLGIFTDSTMPMIDWENGSIYSWEQTAVLAVDSTNSAGIGGTAKVIGVSSMEGAAWNGWAFHVTNRGNNVQPTADLTPYAEGSLHLAIKGNAPSVGVMISSTNQGPGAAPLVDLASKGYLPDSAWHEITIPMSEFGGTLDLTSVFVYAGFVSPSVQFSAFDALATYQVDEVYFVPKP
jgi:hypothetical protein